MAALYGGGLVAWFYGGMSPAIFIARLHEAVSVTHFEVGMIKAPFMALVIGIVASSEGLAGQGKRGIPRQADHNLGRQVDLSGHRARWAYSPCSLRRSECNDAGSGRTICDPRERSRGRISPTCVIDHLSLDVRKGEILGLVGASGGGKSVLMRTIIGLDPETERPRSRSWASTIDTTNARRTQSQPRWGILFQQGALFSSLTALQNVQFPLRENLVLSNR